MLYNLLMVIFSKPQKYQARIITKNQLTKTVYFIQYQLLTPPVIEFVAGQTFMLTVAPNVYRAMSIASSPQNKTVIDSLQDVAPMGVGSKWLLERKIGDEAHLMSPLGRFVIDRESPRKRVLIATGTGIAPFRSMLLDASDGLSGQKDISLYWGLRHNEDIYLTEEFNTLVGKYPNLKFRMILSQPSDGWTGLKGHVTDHILNDEKEFPNNDYYMCGNKLMIAEMSEKLLALGVPKIQLKFDPFY